MRGNIWSTMVNDSKKSSKRTTDNDDPHVFRINGISYMRVPTHNAKRSAEFYETVFAWKVRSDPNHPSFEDGSGHVIGHWVTDLEVVGEAGVVPYIYVASVENTLQKIKSNGGEVVRDPYPEGGLWVATFRDPEGNVLGIWQSGPL